MNHQKVGPSNYRCQVYSTKLASLTTKGQWNKGVDKIQNFEVIVWLRGNNLQTWSTITMREGNISEWKLWICTESHSHQSKPLYNVELMFHLYVEHSLHRVNGSKVNLQYYTLTEYSHNEKKSYQVPLIAYPCSIPWITTSEFIALWERCRISNDMFGSLLSLLSIYTRN